MYRGPFARPHPKFESGFSGVSFDPDTGLRTAAHSSIVAPVTPADVPAAEKPTLLARLWTARPKSPELQKRLHSLLEQFSPLWDEAEQLEVLIVEERRQALESAYQDIRREGRAADKIYKSLTVEYAAAEQAAQAAGLRAEAAREQLANLDLLQKRGLHLPRWYDESELGEWDARVLQAKDRVTSANAAYADAIAVRVGIAEKLREANEKLEALGRDEFRLRKKLAGESFIDPETALPVAGS